MINQAEVLGGTKGAGPMDGAEVHVNFDAPAVLRKWPSLHNARRTEGTSAYMLVDGTLDECIRQFIAKPASARHLYEIHTSPQPPLVSSVLSGEHIIELARLRDFSDCKALTGGFRVLAVARRCAKADAPSW
jgi:hypothetical protein